MGDQAYRGQRAVIPQRAPTAQDLVNRRHRHRGVVDEVERGKNLTKSKVRAKSLASRKRGSKICRGDQAGVRLRQGTLSRAQEKISPPARNLGAGQSLHGTSSSAALPGVECSHCASTLHMQSNTPKDGAQSPTLSLVDEIPIPVLHGQPLVQTFSKGPGLGWCALNYSPVDAAPALNVIAQGSNVTLSSCLSLPIALVPATRLYPGDARQAIDGWYATAALRG